MKGEVKAMRILLIATFLGAFATAMPAWSQADNGLPQQPVPPLAGIQNGDIAADDKNADPAQNDKMLVPPPVSGETYPTAPLVEERSNYLRGGLSFTTAYTDNALGGINGHAISDIGYSVAPSIALDETTPRTHLIATYAPGFTFYQRVSARNESDHAASIDFSYRVSPHVTFSARDAFVKSSNIFNDPSLGTNTAVAGGLPNTNLSVVAPIADVLNNSGNVGLTYQFALNGMIGVSGTFSNLHYPDSSEVPGLFDANSQGGSAFYSRRISKMHYLGVSYQFQRLISYPTAGLSETQTHAAVFFYTLYASTLFSISFFGGPQHSDTIQPPLPPLQLQLPEMRSWTPIVGGSLSWQGRLTTIALSYSHAIMGGGGLIGAVHADTGSTSIRRQLAKRLSGSLAGSYTQNDVLASLLAGGTDGHSLFGTATLERDFGEHFNIALGYSRIHQSYSNVPLLSLVPDTNREFISIKYVFVRPLGR